jgi:kynurenine 3-monooxygenase
LRKKIEAYVGKLCPDRFTPLYTLVTFSPNVGYADAQAKGRAQDKVLDQICALPDIASTFASGARDDEIKRIVSSLASA